MLKTGDNPQGTEQAVFDDMAKGMKEDRAKFFGGFFKDFCAVNLITHPVSTELIQWCTGVAMRASLKATLACAKSFATTDFGPDLPAFKVRTLIIHGTADKTVPIDAAGRAAATAISHSTLVEYEGAAHGLFATEKARFTKDLLDFIRRY
jgi:non-heme chloroperoxidase